MLSLKVIAGSVARVVAALEQNTKDAPEALADFYASTFCAVKGLEIAEIHAVISAEIRAALAARREFKNFSELIDARITFKKSEIKVDGGEGLGVVKVVGDRCEVFYNNEFICTMAKTCAAIGVLIKIITFFKALENENKKF